MDPFDRLPWFVVQSILSNIPDLPSLHRLHNASPAVTTFLHRNNDLFAQIVDALIGNPARERGLLAVRLIVLIWSRDSDSKRMKESYTDILSILQYVREFSPRSQHRSPPIERTISRSTPSAILCRLLSLMTRLRCIAHECFHSMIARCLELRVEHLPKKTKYINTREVVDRSRRPQGTLYVPFDIGPPTWMEEQRLLHGLLCIILFIELRKPHVECSVTTEDGDSIQTILDDDMEGLWKKILWKYNDGQVEQISTLLQWLDEQASSRGNVHSWIYSRVLPEAYSYCCGNLTSMTDQQWGAAEADLGRGRSTRGALCLWRCQAQNGSPLRCVNYSAFRPYGLVFWDCIRMDTLGLPGAHPSRRMWFAWSSILAEEDWETILELQPVTPTVDEMGGYEI